MKTLKNIVLGTMVAACLTGCQKEVVDGNLPLVAKNQAIVMQSANSSMPFGYTLLTDMDYDGSWDVAEKVQAGYTTGSVDYMLFCKKGHLARSVDVPVEFVDKDFFNQYK